MAKHLLVKRAAADGPTHPAIQALPAARRPRVSVIIPCYNYGRWLAECVDSALGQPGVEIDVLIVNDASTDDSAAVAHGLAARDARVRVIDHARNHGHIPSVNEALGQVEGDYLVKLDADDLLTPGSLARSAALLEAHPAVGFVYGQPMHFGRPPGPSLLRPPAWLGGNAFDERPPLDSLPLRARRWTLWPGASWLALRCAAGVNCISQPEVVMRTSALRAVGRYDIALPHTSDLAMWLRLAAGNDVARIEGAVQGLYRVHAGSMMRTVNAGKLKDLRGRLAAFESVLAGRGADLPGADRLLATARARLAGEALDLACRAFDRGRAAREPIEEYVAFAREAYTATETLPQWQALDRRRRIGPRWSPYFPPFMLRVLARRAEAEMAAARWRRHGV